MKENKSLINMEELVTPHMVRGALGRIMLADLSGTQTSGFNDVVRTREPLRPLGTRSRSGLALPPVTHLKLGE